MVRSLGQRVYKVWSDGLMVKYLGQRIREGFILINLQSLLDVIEDLYWPGGDKMALDGIGHFGFPFPGIPFPAESASVRVHRMYKE